MPVVGMIFGVIIILSIMGGAHFYVAQRLYQWLNLLFPHINAKIFIGIYIFLALSMIIALFPILSGIKSILGWIGAHFYGVFFYLLVFTLAVDFAILLASITKIISSPIPQSVLFYSGLLVVLLTVGTVSYGLYNANQVKHASYEIQLREATLDNMKIIVISDSHFGTVNNFEKNLESIVQAINDLNPDIVCWVGDIFNDDFNTIRDPDRAISLLKSIDSTYGVFACLGNHDGGPTLNQMISFLEESKITLLNDEYVIIDERLALFGRLDSSPIGGFGELERQDISDVIVSVGASMPVIIMDHNPSHIKEYGNEVDLILAGHSHRGQVFPASLGVRALFTVDYGYYQRDANSPNVIVTSGVSTWGPPLRVGTNNEIVSIVLH